MRKRRAHARPALLAFLLGTPLLTAQERTLPSAPEQHQPLQLALQNSQAIGAGASAPTPAGSDDASEGVTLTRQQAEQTAIKNNPHVSVAALLAAAQRQVVRETRSAEYPDLNGEVTGVAAEQASRLSTGSLNASRLLNHAGAGIELNQLITDFGRTHNLVASSQLQAKAAEANAEASAAEIVLATDLAFYNALEAQATLQVARSTVAARSSVNEQVGALANAKLKSTLDQSFAQVNLSQANLLQLDAQNQYDAAMAALNSLLGSTAATQYRLIDDPASPQPVASTVDAVVALALQQRPDLQALRITHDADVKFARAQRDQLLPTVSGLGVVGATPYGSSQYFSTNWYGAAGVNVGVPIFNGVKYHAEASEADLRAQAASETTRTLVDAIVRDVRTAWLATATARQRLAVTADLLREANTALDLADTRYRLGLSSIVELSQAQLQQTEAQIADANARFEYEAKLAELRFQSGMQP